MVDGAETLTLKWGTLNAWDVQSEACMAALKRYAQGPVSLSVMTQRDTPEQKQALCDLIDAVDGPIYTDWEGGAMTKDEAKKYVMEYGPSPSLKEGAA
jgi:hypothetical protein